MSPEDYFARRVLAMKSMAAALVGGVMGFAAVSIYVVNYQGPLGKVPAPGAWPLLSVVALGVLAVCGPLSVAIPNLILRGGIAHIVMFRRRFVGMQAIPSMTDEGRLLGVRQRTLLVSLALLESAGFMGGMAYLLEGQAFALTIVAVAVVFMLFQFPTQGRIRAWLERHVTLITELRQLGGPSDPY